MGDAGIPGAPPPDAREALTKRTIPTMTLSTASNPFTAPLEGIDQQSATERASARFAIRGNAVITGGAGTLALACGRAMLEHGLQGLALHDLEPTLKSSSLAIEHLMGDFPDRQIITHAVNVTEETQVMEAMADTVYTLGSIDILCCFAGVVGCVPSLHASLDEWRRVVDINLNGSFLCAQAAAKHMISPMTPTNGHYSYQPMPGKSILFISSISAHHVNYPQPQAAYNVSKAGVAHLTKNLAAEWAVHGIRVNCISPGYMDTVLNAGDSLQAVRDVWASRCPMGRMGDVEELTGAVVMLSGQRSGRYTTGAEIVVDGGATCF